MSDTPAIPDMTVPPGLATHATVLADRALEEGRPIGAVARDEAAANPTDEALAELARLLTPRTNRYIPWQPSETQTAFLLLDCREALYGGAAGGGKSVALLMAALQYVDVPGYHALLLRRTFAALSKPGALIDLAHEWLRGTDATWNEQRKQWTFPSGATLSFGYLDTEGDKYQYQGAAFSFCVGRGTPVLMATGDWCAIEDVRVGDEVATLLGPRRVTKTHAPGIKPVVRVSSGGKSIIASESHRLLTSDGWASPLELRPTARHECDRAHEESPLPCPTPDRPHECRCAGLPPNPSRAQQSTEEIALSGTDASEASGRSDCEASGGAPQAAQPPQAWSFRARLLSRAARQTSPASAVSTHLDESGRVHGESSPQGYASGCLACRRCGGGQPHCQSEGGRESTPQRGDVEGRNVRLRSDGRANTPPRTQTESPALIHPYTSARLDATEACHEQHAQIVPVGEEEVFDLTVDEASHYVTWGGFVAQNCGFDELTQFTRTQYTYLFSRCRKRAEGEASKVPLRVRAASNPGGEGHAWVYERFFAEGRSKGRVFIPALLADNPYLDAESYREMLAELSPVERRQLEDGDWRAVVAGDWFRAEWWEYVEPHQLPMVRRRVRYWDTASTKPSARNRDPDYYVGVLMSEWRGVFYVEDVERFRLGPAEAEARLEVVAKRDGPDVEVWMAQEPGSQSEHLVHTYARTIFRGHTFRGDRQTGDKVHRAKPLSAGVHNKVVKLVRAAWNRDFTDECEAFFNPSVHDDQVDAASGAHSKLARAGAKMPIVSVVATPNADRM